MDLSKFSTEDLQALRARDLSKMSDEGLAQLRAGTAAAQEEEDPEGVVNQIMHKGEQAFHGAGKLANILWPLTGTLEGAALEKFTKSKNPAWTAQELKDQYNPTNLKSFPSLSTMAERVGIPEGGKLSDLKPSWYAKPDPENHWWQPEVGGTLDPTLRGTAATAGQVGTDLATWLTAGTAPAGKAVLGKFAAESAGPIRSVLQKLIGAGTKTVEGIGTVTGAKYLGSKLGESSVGPLLQKATNPIGTAVGALGTGLYGHKVMPIEHQGERFGKEGIVEDLYNAGVVGPWGIQKRVAGARDALGSASQDLLDRADDLGARGSMERAVQPAQEAIGAIRSQTPEALAMAQDLQQGVNGYVARERGTPGTPSSPGRPPVLGTRASPILDETGQPFQRPVIVDKGTLPTPGTPGVPGLPTTANQLAHEKRWLYDNEIPQSSWDVARKSGKTGIGVEKQLAHGLKTEAERAVESKIPGGGADLADLNRAYGGLATTKGAQRFVENRADRQLGDLLGGTGVDATIGGIGAVTTGSFKGGLTMIGIKKALQAYQQGTMPLGYLLKMLGESNSLDRLNAMSQSKPAGGK